MSFSFPSWSSNVPCQRMPFLKWTTNVQLWIDKWAQRFHTMRLVSTASEFADVATEFIESTLLTSFWFSILASSVVSSSGRRLYVCRFVVIFFFFFKQPSSIARSHTFPLSLWQRLLRVMFVLPVRGRGAEPVISWLLRGSTCSPNLIHTHN